LTAGSDQQISAAFYTSPGRRLTRKYRQADVDDSTGPAGHISSCRFRLFRVCRYVILHVSITPRKIRYIALLFS